MTAANISASRTHPASSSALNPPPPSFSVGYKFP